MTSMVKSLFPGTGYSRETTAVLEEFGLAQALACRPVEVAEQEVPSCHEKVQPSEGILDQIRRLGLWKEGQPLRLHLGCGENRFDGYVNVDYQPSEHTVQRRIAADLFADITTLDLPDLTVDEVRLHHVFEHFNRPSALALLIRWHRWLKTGGRLHIETPDLMGNAELLLSDLSWKTKMALVRHIADPMKRRGPIT